MQVLPNVASRATLAGIVPLEAEYKNMQLALHKWGARAFMKVDSNQNWVVIVKRGRRACVAKHGTHKQCCEWVRKHATQADEARLERRDK